MDTPVEQPEAMPGPLSGPPRRVSASRGAVLMTAAQGLFAVTAAFLHFWLGHRLEPAGYGTFVVLLVLYSLVNLVQNSGIWPAMSKRIAETPTGAAVVFGMALRTQLAWSALTTAAGVALAWPVAWLIRDQAMAPLIALTCITVPLFSLYSLAAGYHNGLHSFDRQARMLTGYTLGRLAATVALVLALPRSLGPVAALVGFASGPIVGVLAGLGGVPWGGALREGTTSASTTPETVADTGPRAPAATPREATDGAAPEPLTWRELAGFAAPVTIAAGAMVLVMSLDVLAVKAFVRVPEVVGHYSAASTIATLPYMAFAALSAVVLPTVASLKAERAAADAARAVSDTLRVIVVLLLPVVVLPAAVAPGLVQAVYGSGFAAAARPLVPLLIGYGFLAYALIEQNVANGLGRPRVSMAAGLFSVGVSVVANLLLVPRYGAMGAAAATFLAGVAMVYGIRPALRADGVTTETLRWLPALVAAVAVGYGMWLLAPAGWVALAALAAGLAIALAISFLARSLTREDVGRLVSGLTRG